MALIEYLLWWYSRYVVLVFAFSSSVALVAWLGCCARRWVRLARLHH